MRTRRGITSAGFRESRSWVEIAKDFGAVAIYLIDPAWSHNFKNSLHSYSLGKYYSKPVRGAGPSGRDCFIFNEDYFFNSDGSVTFPSTTSYSFEFWFKIPPSGNLDDRVIFSSYPVAVRTRTSGELAFSYISSTSLASGYMDNTWHHCVFTANGSQAFLYIDKVLKFTYWGSLSRSSLTIFYGSDFSVPSYTPSICSISSGAVYNKFLTPSQVRALYHGVGPEPSTSWTYTSFGPYNALTGAQIIDLSDLLQSEPGFGDCNVVEEVVVSVDSNTSTSPGSLLMSKYSLFGASPWNRYADHSFAGSVSCDVDSFEAYKATIGGSGDFTPSEGTQEMTWYPPGLNPFEGDLEFRFNVSGTLSYNISDITVKWQ